MGEFFCFKIICPNLTSAPIPSCKLAATIILEEVKAEEKIMTVVVVETEEEEGGGKVGEEEEERPITKSVEEEEEEEGVKARGQMMKVWAMGREVEVTVVQTVKEENMANKEGGSTRMVEVAEAEKTGAGKGGDKASLIISNPHLLLQSVSTTTATECLRRFWFSGRIFTRIF